MLKKLSRHSTFRQLQIFEAVARRNSVTRAAEDLFLTQSTVSTQLKKLTDIVGMPLVKYVSKQLDLTDAGKYMYSACKEISLVLDNVDTAVANLKGVKKDTLNISVISTAKYFVPEVLGRFWQAYPDIDVSLNVLNRKQVLERLTSNEDDLYILGHNPTSDFDIHAIAFAPNPLYVMASKNHSLVKLNRRMSLLDVAEQPLILRETGSGIRNAVENLFNANGLKPKIRLVLSNNEAIKHAVISQLGLSILSLHAILKEGTNGPVSVLEVENFPISQQWHVVYAKEKGLSDTAKSFLQCLLDEGQLLSQQLNKLTATIERHYQPKN